MAEVNNLAKLLVVARVGDSSLHHSWCSGNFDLAVSYFGKDAERTFDEAIFTHRFSQGGKFDSIFNFFQTYPETKHSYDYYWFPDDDLRATPADVERLLSIGQEMKLDLFQPSLDSESYFSHLITLQHPSFRLRYTNFVEVMAPMLSARLFNQVLSSFAETRSGFGLDFLWPEVAAKLPDAGRNVAIIDEVAITHTRPVGGVLQKFMKATGGRSVEDEFAQSMSAVTNNRTTTIRGVSTPRIQIVGAKDHHGHDIQYGRLAGLTIGDLLFRNRNRVQAVKSVNVFKHAAKAALASRT